MVQPVVEYAVGRYDCRCCGEAVLVTQATHALPTCPRCGSRKYKGQAPKVYRPKAPPPRQYESGMYQCSGCGDRVIIAQATTRLPHCAICGKDKLEPL